jgi:hypothetical protein
MPASGAHRKLFQQGDLAGQFVTENFPTKRGLSLTLFSRLKKSAPVSGTF